MFGAHNFSSSRVLEMKEPGGKLVAPLLQQPLQLRHHERSQQQHSSYNENNSSSTNNDDNSSESADIHYHYTLSHAAQVSWRLKDLGCKVPLNT